MLQDSSLGSFVLSGFSSGHPPSGSRRLERDSRSSGYVNYEPGPASVPPGRWLTQNMQSYLVEMINERKRSDDKREKADLLSSLVNANEKFLGGGGKSLGEEELIGMGPALDPPAGLLTNLPFRKRVLVLLCWIRGEFTPV